MPIRLAVRAVVVNSDRLLLVNAYPPRPDETASPLWCAPGGGVEPHASLTENLVREVHEETGLLVSVVGYTLLYRVLPRLSLSEAGLAQLSVPVVAMAMGVAALGEVPTLEAMGAGLLTLAGIAVASRQPTRRSSGS